MKNSKKTFIFSAALAGLFLLLPFAAMPARAAAPELINFQGKLTDPTGKAITNAVPMVFTFYTAATGGAVAWQETQTVTPDESGIYTVLLGTVTPLNVSFSTAYWLGVKVGTDLEMTPRYQLVSSAYSLYSINSGTAAWAAGADWSGIINKPSFASGDVTLASTQTFTGLNTFANQVNTNAAYQIYGSTVLAALPGTGSLGVGFSAGMANTGDGNSFLGYQAGLINTTGNHNSFLGYQAGDDNTAGNDNSFLGYQAGFSNNTGGGNSFVGLTAGYNNTTGDSNSILGYAAGFMNQTGSDNAVFGYQAGRGGSPGHSFSNSTLMGYQAGYSLTTGSNNTLLGWMAGFSLGTGDGNILIGSGVDVGDSSYQLNIGNVVYGDLLTGNVAIGTTTLTSTFTVVGTFALVDGTQGAGRVLTSDTNGLASWQTAGSVGDVVLAATQTFTGQNTFTKGVFFDSIIQSTGPGDGGFVGNSRGANAVDLQTSRSATTQVASGQYSVISGGVHNKASGIAAIVGGGGLNTASGNAAAVSGGGSNTASGDNAIVSGGGRNMASGDDATVSGGNSNTASGQGATVPGGYYNTAKGAYSFAAGYISSSTADGSFTWADSEGTEVYNDVADRTWFKNRGGFLISNTAVASAAAFAVDSTGNVGISTAAPTSTFTVVGIFKLQDGTQGANKVLTSDVNGRASWATVSAGDVYQASTQTFTGQNTFSKGVFFDSIIQSTGPGAAGVVGDPRGPNAVDLQTSRSDTTRVASGDRSVIGGGSDNTASGTFATVSGGWFNTASDVGSIVSGGSNNTASGVLSIVSGGSNNTAIGGDSVVSGGDTNNASNIYATVSGGVFNTASGQYATVSGGKQNTANGNYSFAAGRASNSTVAGAFTWADSEGTAVNNTVADSTWFKNRGGFLVTGSTQPISDGGFFVSGAGNVGIGTTAPGAKLEVNGDILLSQGADRTISVATTTTNVAGNNLTIAAGNSQHSGVYARPGGNLYLSGGNAYGLSGTDYAGKVYIYGGTGGMVPYGDVILAHDGTNPKGNVGIGTITPAATLDINGFMRLKRNSSQPVGCGVSTDGAIALTHAHTMCVCDGSAWKFITDGTTPCVW